MMRLSGESVNKFFYFFGMTKRVYLQTFGAFTCNINQPLCWMSSQTKIQFNLTLNCDQSVQMM